MEKKLVIVESPAKAKTINKILGGEFIVKSSVGHIRDLPQKKLGIDIKDNFKPTYVVSPDKKKIVEELKKAAASCSEIYLAPDPDREGEAIAWHLKYLLSQKENSEKKFFRVQYNEITPKAVREAFKNPGEINQDRVDAQQARRVLDRIVGYMVSPVLWRRIKRGLSAGRVQSVALRLVCEREEEIRNFKPEEYWILGAIVRKFVEPLDRFRIKLAKINGEKADVKNADQAHSIRKDLDGAGLIVKEISTKEISRKPQPPYITSTLQQAGSSYCSFPPSRTMGIAQKLYEGVDLGDGPVGLITYMRTDSVALSDDAVKSCRSFIVSNFGREYCPAEPNIYKSKSGSQEAHEAIRPTDVNRTPEMMANYLDVAELKLYRLIWQRFVACQMAPARLGLKMVKIDAVPKPPVANTYLFHVNTSEVLFPGYMKVAGIEQEKKPEGEEQLEKVPPLAEGEKLECLEWLEEMKQTQPPPRYSEATLIKALEYNGVGRPSTYQSIVGTLFNRKYVEKEKKTMAPTEIGMQVNTLLVTNLNELFDVKFTAGMEELLDEVEMGKVVWTKMLADFYGKFDKWMEGTAEAPADVSAVNKLVKILEGVDNWAEPVVQGKRTFSDKAFVDSIAEQAKEGSKDISMRQLNALVKVALKYKEQASGVVEAVHEIGMGSSITGNEHLPPSEETIKKLELLKDLPLKGFAEKFTASIRQQVERGRSLSHKQIGALDRIVLANAEHIPDFENHRLNLKIEEKKVEPTDDKESGPMIQAMASVTEWKEPVTRGKMVFDDKKFYASLKEQFEKKGALSFKQKNALKKMTTRYKSQIPDFEKLFGGAGTPVK